MTGEIGAAFKVNCKIIYDYVVYFINGKLQVSIVIIEIRSILDEMRVESSFGEILSSPIRIESSSSVFVTLHNQTIKVEHYIKKIICRNRGHLLRMISTRFYSTGR